MEKNLRLALIIGGTVVAALILVPLILGLIVGWRGYGYGMMGPWMMGGLGGMWFMPLIMIVFWGLIIWGIVALMRGGGWAGVNRNGSSGSVDTALEILKRRYARGEIDTVEFDEKKKALS